MWRHFQDWVLIFTTYFLEPQTQFKIKASTKAEKAKLKKTLSILAKSKAEIGVMDEKRLQMFRLIISHL
jgi:hypothetical protein